MKLRYKISLFIFGFVICFFISVSLILNSNSDISSEMEQGEELILSEQEIINDCNNIDLSNTSICLRDNIKPFFIYNITNDSLTLSLDELKKRGGDCRNWAFLYERLGKELNFNASTVKVGGIKGVFNSHRYAVLWDNSSYCKLDMLDDVECYKIKN